jgi:hypothetical protein
MRNASKHANTADLKFHSGRQSQKRRSNWYISPILYHSLFIS